MPTVVYNYIPDSCQSSARGGGGELERRGKGDIMFGRGDSVKNRTIKVVGIIARTTLYHTTETGGGGGGGVEGME